MTISRHAKLGWRSTMASLAILFLYYLTLIDNQLNWLTATNHKLVVRADSSLVEHQHKVVSSDNQQERLIQQNNNGELSSSSLKNKRQASSSSDSVIAQRLLNHHQNHDITEHDLLPFSYFFIPQPPFSDIVKTSRSNNHQASIGRDRSSSERYEQQQRQLSLLNGHDGTENNNINNIGTQSNSNSNNINYHLQLYNQYTELSKGSNYNHLLDTEQDEELEYTNSVRDQDEQVLYYGPQLVREGELYEIGCFLPKDDFSEWTKSGHKVLDIPGYKTVKRNFLNTKTNFTLRVWEASLNDTGNYRCNRYARKAHRLIVVPNQISNSQLYQVQQQLIQLANSNNGLNNNNILRQWNSNGISSTNNALLNNQINQGLAVSNNNNNLDSSISTTPAIVIVENKTIIWNCNISDEYILKKLDSSPNFQLAWFKNGKQVLPQSPLLPLAPMPSRSPQPPTSAPMPNPMLHDNNNNNNRPMSSSSVSSTRSSAGRGKPVIATSGRQQHHQEPLLSDPNERSDGNAPRISPPTTVQRQQLLQTPVAPRIQFRQNNGRQLYIESAQYGDAGDWLCSWSKILNTIQASESDDNDYTTGSSRPINPHSAGSMIQLLAPVKLRRYRASYKLKRGNDLRLKCSVERGFPTPQITWFIGNEIVDPEYLRNNEGKVQVLSNNDLILQQQHLATSADVQPTITLTTDGGTYMSPDLSDNRNPDEEKKYIIDITPKVSQHKLRHNANMYAQGNHGIITRKPGHNTVATTSSAMIEGGISSSSLLQSALVVRDLDIDKHTSRYACRAQNRVNFDEVSTMLRIQASSVVTKKPINGKATLVAGQDLLLECEKTDDKKANFKWYRTRLNSQIQEEVSPEDDAYDIHNERLWIKKSVPSSVADYHCRALKSDSTANENEQATFNVRAQPFIEDFDLATSHTGKSGIITDGERLELKCEVRNTSGSVEIHWLKSATPDDEANMVDLENISKSDHIRIIQDENNKFVKTLVIETVRMNDRGHYMCRADNGVTEKGSRTIFIRVRDKLVALWPLLGIVSELAILFSIIFIWENQRANCQ